MQSKLALQSAALLYTPVSATLGSSDSLSLHLQYPTTQAPLLASLERVLPALWVLPLLGSTGLPPAPSVDSLVSLAFPSSLDLCSCAESPSPLGKKFPQQGHISQAGHPYWVEHTAIFTHSLSLAATAPTPSALSYAQIYLVSNTCACTQAAGNLQSLGTGRKTSSHPTLFGAFKHPAPIRTYQIQRKLKTHVSLFTTDLLALVKLPL